MKPTPRWGPLPWFVLVLTLLVLLLVGLLPPLVLDEVPPAWVMRSAARLASYHGDPEPIEVEWLETSRAEAVRVMESAVEPSPSPSPSPEATAEIGGGDTSTLRAELSAAANPSPSPLEEPGRAVQLVVMRGRFDSAPPGGPPPTDAPERWIVAAYDDLSHERWRLVVLDAPPVLPEDAASFEL